MILTVRTTPITQGKIAEAMDFASKGRTVLREKCGWQGDVVSNLSGNINQIHWIGRFESLAAFEAWRQDMETNDDYNSLLKESADLGLFVTSAVADTFYQEV